MMEWSEEKKKKRLFFCWFCLIWCLISEFDLRLIQRSCTVVRRQAANRRQIQKRSSGFGKVAQTTVKGAASVRSTTSNQAQASSEKCQALRTKDHSKFTGLLESCWCAWTLDMDMGLGYGFSKSLSLSLKCTRIAQYQKHKEQL
jgi:hypothetical protein